MKQLWAKLTRRGLEGSLYRYQFMANIVGTLIIPLFVFTGIKIFTGHSKIEVEIFGVAHGYLYIVYLVTAGALGLKARINVVWILAMFAAGLIPGMTFVVEWWITTRKIQPRIAALRAEQAPEGEISPIAQ
jgi:integral membrane protein